MGRPVSTCIFVPEALLPTVIVKNDDGTGSTTNKLVFQDYIDLLLPESLKKEKIVSERQDHLCF